MSKLWFVLVLVIIVGLIWSGIVEINVNKPAQYTSFSSATNTIVKEKATYEQGRAYTVGLKRRVESFVVRDKEKRLVLSLLYVRTDAARLQKLIDSGNSPAALLPQAQLLVSSIDQVRANAEKAPVKVVARMRKDSAQTFAAAQQALSGLQEQREEYNSIHKEFSRLTGSLEQQIGDLDPEEEEEKEESVAGTKDEPEASKIPLNF